MAQIHTCRCIHPFSIAVMTGWPKQLKEQKDYLGLMASGVRVHGVGLTRHLPTHIPVEGQADFASLGK